MCGEALIFLLSSSNCTSIECDNIKKQLGAFFLPPSTTQNTNSDMNKTEALNLAVSFRDERQELAEACQECCLIAMVCLSLSLSLSHFPANHAAVLFSDEQQESGGNEGYWVVFLQGKSEGAETQIEMKRVSWAADRQAPACRYSACMCFLCHLIING